jgi:DNA-binding NarL/FixJ family response regulator
MSAPIRILLVDDLGIDTTGATSVLQEAMRCEVIPAATPDEAMTRLRRERYDVAVVDMLYLGLEDAFRKRRSEGRVQLTDRQLLMTGLAVLREVAAGGSGCAPVLFTNGEPNRRLHIMFAYQQLGCRVMCPKDATKKLPEAVRAAAAGREYIDGLVRTWFAPRNAPTIEKTFLSSAPQRAIWRAMALGLRDYPRIAEATNNSPSTVSSNVKRMYQALCDFDPGYDRDGRAIAELTCYASENWQFFLDDTVRVMYR